MDGFGDYDWVAWLGLAVLLGIVEVTSLDLVFAMLAVGALAARSPARHRQRAAADPGLSLVVSVGDARRGPADRAQATCAPPSRSAPAPRPWSASRASSLEQVGRRRRPGQAQGRGLVGPPYDPHAHVIEAGRHVEVVQIDGATAVVYESEI